jgi:inorganic pyrophosphatase
VEQQEWLVEIEAIIEIPKGSREDGDPLDVLVLLDEPTFPGCHMLVRPIGVFWMRDEKGPDAKIVAVPSQDPRWAGVNDIADMRSFVLDEIAHFFDVYKDLEPDKSTETRGWEGVEPAIAEIEAARARAH